MKLRNNIFLKILLVTVFFVGCLMFLEAQTAAAPEIGDGTEDNPYRIATLENLYWIAADDEVVPNPNRENRWSSHYIQTYDVNASETIDWFAGAGWESIGSYINPQDNSPFTGVYNGQGYAIDSLYINRTRNRGLFGHADGAYIKNLGLTNVDITGGTNTGDLVGWASYSTISDSYCTGYVRGGNWTGGLIGRSDRTTTRSSYNEVTVRGASFTGGLIGWNKPQSPISYSWSAGKVTGFGIVGGLVGINDQYSLINNCYSIANVTGTGSVTGGLIGYNSSSDISKSYSTGKVNGNYIAGGLVGLNKSSDIEYCYSAGNLTGSDYIGGLVAFSPSGDDSADRYNYWDTQASGQDASLMGRGRTTDQMTYPYSENTFVGWDFDEIWGSDIYAVINNGYPFLEWQCKAVIQVLFEYSIDEEDPSAAMLYIPINQEPHQLNFGDSNNTGYVSMIRGREYSSSSEFVIESPHLLNGMEKVAGFSDSLPVITVEGNNNFAINYSFTIHSENADPENNQRSVSAEIWTADFQYGVDNYSFSNKEAPTKSLRFEATKDILRLNKTGIFGFVPKSIIEQITNYAMKGGLCFGHAFTSTHYKNDARLIPVYETTPYELELSRLVRRKLEEGYKTQAFINLKTRFNEVARSKESLSQDYLSSIKDNLSDNNLLIASYNNQANVLHTMIKRDNQYHLYEYNSNYNEPENEYTAANRNHTFSEEEGRIEFNVDNKRFDFSRPISWSGAEYDSTDYSSILQDLIAWEIDSLYANQQNMIIYHDRPYISRSNYGDPVADITFCFEVEMSAIGSYRLYYMDNDAMPEIDITTNQVGVYTIIAIITDQAERRNHPRQVLFSNLPSYKNLRLSEIKTKAKISDIFGEQPTCEIDLNQDGQDVIIIHANYNDEVVDDDNAPPPLKKQFPLTIFFRRDQHRFNLPNYFAVQEPENLEYSIVSHSHSVQPIITETLLTVNLIDEFEGIATVRIEVCDGVRSINYNMYFGYLCESLGIEEEYNDHDRKSLITALKDAYPNPFNPYTNIVFSVCKDTQAELVIYNIRGQLIKTLHSGFIKAGEHRLIWKGKDEYGRDVGSGVYFYRLKTDEYDQVNKMLLVK